MIDLINAIIRKEIPQNENPNKIVNIVEIVEKILDFDKQKKGKEIKTLTPEQIIQRLPIALAQVNAGNTSENLLNKIHKVIYSLYQEKKVAKKYITI